MSEGIPTTRTGMRLEEEQALSSTCSSLFMSSAPERAGSNEFFRQFLSLDISSGLGAPISDAELRIDLI